MLGTQDSSILDISNTDREITVNSATELKAALQAATGGETILIGAGNYGKLNFSQYAIDSSGYASNVTLKSADATDPAVFTEITLNGAQNLVFDGLTVDYTYAEGDFLGTNAVSLSKSHDITFRNMLLDGDDHSGSGDPRTDGYPTGRGMDITSSQDITVEDSLVQGFWKGINVGRSQDVVLRGNELTDLRSDGLNFAQITDVLVEDNHIHDFRTSDDSDDHADMIQMWTAGTTERSSGLTIRGNVLDIGEGGITQMIFLEQTRSTLEKVGDANWFEDILIEDNVLIGSHVHGITVGFTDGLVVKNNTLLPPEDNAGNPAPRINLDAASLNLVVTDNVTHAPITLDDGTLMPDNFIVQKSNPGDAGYYGDTFVNAVTDATNALANLQVRPGSELALSGAGSSLLTYNETPETLTALITQDPGDARNVILFDAGLSADALGAAAAQGARFLWDFGDGTQGEGATVTHTYSATGRYTAQLTVEMPDGTRAQTTAKADIPSPDVLSFDSSLGQLHSHNFDDVKLLQTTTGALQLDETQSLQIKRCDVSSLFNAENFRLSAEICTEMGGEFLRQHTALLVEVTRSGELRVSLTLQDGETLELTTSGAGLSDGDLHKIDVIFDGTKDGSGLTLCVDGEDLASGAVTGITKPEMYWDMTIGREDSRGFTGEVHSLNLTVGEPIVPRPAPQASAPSAFETFMDGDIFGLSTGDTFELDFANTDRVAEAEAPQRLAMDSNATGLVLDGDPFKIGRLAEFEDSTQLAMNLCFARETADEGSGRLVWNHTRLGVTLLDDGLQFHLAQENASNKNVTVNNLGLDDTDLHELTLLRDTEADLFVAVLDGEIILTMDDTDLTLDANHSHQWGWTLGSKWKGAADIDIHSFQLTDIDIDLSSLNDWAA